MFLLLIVKEENPFVTVLLVLEIEFSSKRQKNELVVLNKNNPLLILHFPLTTLTLPVDILINSLYRSSLN
jgi:hypothetical protein